MEVVDVYKEGNINNKFYIYGLHRPDKEITLFYIGKVMSVEARRKMSEAKVGYIPWNKKAV